MRRCCFAQRARPAKEIGGAGALAKFNSKFKIQEFDSLFPIPDAGFRRQGVNFNIRKQNQNSKIKI